jgi:glycosyltransferase involved in cell wall biosynthesis
MNPRLKFSLITVCFNSATYIADTLQSVDMQTWGNFEHLIVDGASTDNTLQIVNRYSNEKRRVVSEPDRGIYDAMNKGIALAQGDILGFINSDDVYPNSRVLELVGGVLADQTLDGCYGNLRYVRQSDVNTAVRYWRSGPFVPGLFSRGWCPPHPTLFLRRNVYERFGGFDLRYPIAADMELMTRLLEVHRISTAHIDRVLVHMRMGGMTNRSVKNIFQQNREIWRALHAHNLAPSAFSFVKGKAVARARQFLNRSDV